VDNFKIKLNFFLEKMGIQISLVNIIGVFQGVTFTQGPRYTPGPRYSTPLGQGTPSQQILDPLGPEYTHRAKVHLTQQLFDLRHTLISKS